MADTLTQEMQDAIQRNLPAQVAGVLQQHLVAAATAQARLTDAEAEVVTLKQRVKDRDQTLAERASKIGELEAKLAIYAARETAFKASELTVLTAKHQAAVAEAARYAAMDVIGQVFRNATVKRTVLENGMASAGVGTQPGGYPMAMSVPTNNSVTATEEQQG